MWRFRISFSPGKQEYYFCLFYCFQNVQFTMVEVKGALAQPQLFRWLRKVFGPTSPKWTFGLDYPESHLIPLPHFAIQCLVPKCLVNITVKTVLSDFSPDFCILLPKVCRGAWRELEAEYLIPRTSMTHTRHSKIICQMIQCGNTRTERTLPS
jgi:hypothetical protein